MGTARKKWTTKKRLVALIAFTAPVLYAMKAYSHNIVWNLTDSVYFNFAYYQDAPIKKGDYVEFGFSHPLIRNGDPVRLTKRIACMPGDMLTTVGQNLFCNDTFVGEAFRSTKKGNPLVVYTLNDRIPDGMVFVSGDAEHSFDSRYWGLLKMSDVRRVVPIW